MADTTVPNTVSTALASYIVDTVFSDMSTNRQPLEIKWNECREAFQSVVTGKWKADEATGTRSQTVINETRQKIMAAYSILIDTLLTGGRIPFMLSPSPWDNTVIEDLPEEEQDLIRDGIEDMTGLIQQQLRDCNADRALMKNVLSLCEYGLTFSKKSIITITRKGYAVQQLDLSTGPIMDVSRLPEYTNQYRRTIESHDSPSWEYASVWDVFTDLETDNLREGYGVIHRQYVSPYWLRRQKGSYLFIDDAIEDAIKTAANEDNTKLTSADQNTLTPQMRDVQKHRKTIRYLEFWGRLPRAKVEEYERYLQEQVYADAEGYEIPTLVFDENGNDDSGDEVEVMVCVAGGHIVRYARTEQEMRPFFRAVFEENLDELGPRGIAQNVTDMQRVLNGVFRSIEDNMKLSANVILGTIDDMIDGNFDKVVPGQRVHLNPEAAQSNQPAIMPIVVPNVTAPLMELFGVVRNALDEESMVPRTLQGIQIDKGRDTAYEIAQRVERAGKYLAQVIRNIDEGLIEPMISEFYSYNMDDPDVDAGKKGNYVVKALGFTSYQDRVVRIQNLRTFVEIALAAQPIAGELAWRQIAESIAKSLDLDIDQTMLSRQDKERAAQMQQGGQQDLEAQKVAAETEKLKAEAEATRAGVKLKAADTEIKRADQLRKVDETEAKTAQGAVETSTKIKETEKEDDDEDENKAEEMPPAPPVEPPPLIPAPVMLPEENIPPTPVQPTPGMV